MKKFLLASVQLGISLLLSHFCESPMAAQTWQRLDPSGGNVISLAASSDGTLFLGASDGHIFASSDAAAHWELRGRVGGRLDGVVQHLLVDARAPQHVFAAVWFQDPQMGGGIFRSDDGARTWRLSGLPGEAVRTIEQSRSQPDVFIAGTHTGVFRSNDSGLHWERMSPVDDEELKNIDSLAVDPSDARVIYVGTYHLPWKTTDGGESWSAIIAGMIDDSDIMTIRIDTTNPSRIFASACSGIYRSENAGLAWTKLQGIPYASRRTQSIVQDPRDPRVFYAGTTEGLWLTRDSGESWIRATPPEWVINAISVNSPSSGAGKLILGTEGQGILVSEDSAATFSASNAGFSHRVVAALLGDPRNPQHLLSRVSGLTPSLLESHDSGKSWQSLPGDEPSSGIEKLFATESGWWASLVAGGVARYDDSTSKWLHLTFQPPATSRVRTRAAPRSAKSNSVAISKPDPQVLDVQVSGARVFVASVDGLWSGELSKPLLRLTTSSGLTGTLRSLAIIPGGTQLWAASNDQLFYSNDSGKSWRNETLSHSLGALLWIRLIPLADGFSLFLGTQNGVYRRALVAESSWQLLQSGLPASAMNPPWASGNKIVIPSKSSGLYLSLDSGATWQRLDSPLEDSIFTGIAGDNEGGLIVGSRTEGFLHWIPASPSQ